MSRFLGCLFIFGRSIICASVAMVLLSVRSGPESNRRPAAYKAAALPAELPEQVPHCPAGPGCRLSGCRSDLIPTCPIEPSNKPQLREWHTEGPSLCPILYRVGPSPVIDPLSSGPGAVEGQQYDVSGPFRVRTPDTLLVPLARIHALPGWRVSSKDRRRVVCPAYCRRRQNRGCITCP